MKIVIHTEPNAEDNCMLQSLNSRSSKGVEHHRRKLKEVGSGNFMKQYYGFGQHGSIAEGGFETIYLEGISMLAAKAIEDYNLFIGQECSSRYIDFSTQLLMMSCHPDGPDGEEDKNLAEHYQKFYSENLPLIQTHLYSLYCKEDEEKELGAEISDAKWRRTIEARAFDIIRGYLPTGATTNTSWTANLRNLNEHLIKLMHHPLFEVSRSIAKPLYLALYEKYPNSFNDRYVGWCTDDSGHPFYCEELAEIEGEETASYLHDPDHFFSDGRDPCIIKPVSLADRDTLGVDIDSSPMLGSFWDDLQGRTRKLPLPRHYRDVNETLDIHSMLDFGSFRDIQRHRNGYCSMPLVTTEYGFHPWYFDNLPEECRPAAVDLFKHVDQVYKERCKHSIRSTRVYEDYREPRMADLAEEQYLLPMGMVVPVDLKYSLAQSVYVAELRSSKTVHSTLRPLAQAIGAVVDSFDVPCFYDKDEKSFTHRRGDQTILSKD